MNAPNEELHDWARTAVRRTLAPLLINAAWFAYWYEQMGEWE